MKRKIKPHDNRINFSMPDIKKQLDVPEGGFYEKLFSISKRLNLPKDKIQLLIRQRMEKTGKHKLYIELVQLQNRVRVFEKVLAGEQGTKFHVVVPEGKQEIERQIDEMAVRLAEILHSI